MKLPQLLMFVVVVGAILLYFFLRRGPSGEEYVGRKLGLELGETIVELWQGEYDRRFLGEGTAFWGGYPGLQSLLIAVTDRDRLVIGNQSREEEPLSWHKGDLAGVEIYRRNEGEMMNPSGALEPADVLDLQQVDGPPLRIRVPRSAAELFRRYCRK